MTKSMATFPDNIDVQHAACVAVGNLANRDTENKRRLGAAGACNKVGRSSVVVILFILKKRTVQYFPLLCFSRFPLYSGYPE